jgi:hypothetical protein
VLATLAALLLAGCTYRLAGPATVLKPEGETVTVERGGAPAATGELVVVEGDRLVLLREGRLAAVPLEGVRRVAVTGYPAVKLPKERARLVLYARYPQGLTPEQWRELLRRLGQAEIEPVPGVTSPR